MFQSHVSLYCYRSLKMYRELDKLTTQLQVHNNTFSYHKTTIYRSPHHLSNTSLSAEQNVSPTRRVHKKYEIRMVFGRNRTYWIRQELEGWCTIEAIKQRFLTLNKYRKKNRGYDTLDWNYTGQWNNSILKSTVVHLVLANLFSYDTCISMN